MNSNNSDSFLSSKETKMELKLHDCDLAHIRNSGKLQFTKKGNAYLYSKESIEELKKNLRR
jgi:hypothetical protein